MYFVVVTIIIMMVIVIIIIIIIIIMYLFQRISVAIQKGNALSFTYKFDIGNT